MMHSFIVDETKVINSSLPELSDQLAIILSSFVELPPLYMAWSINVREFWHGVFDF